MLQWDTHLIYFEDALAKNDRCEFAAAVESWDEALRLRESMHARWNRGQALLSLGRYAEGFRDYAVRFALFPNMLNLGGAEVRARLPLWRGEDITGRRLVLLGEQGYGDVIMLARYVPLLKARGIDVVLAVPAPLHRLLTQLAPISSDGDLCCPIFDLMAHLQQTADTVPGAPYLRPDPLRARELLPHDESRRRIGIAWKAGQEQHPREFQRSIPIAEFVALVARTIDSDAELVALQPNDREQAIGLGITVPDYRDFADVAAVASRMDMVVSADVAAINVVGAIGHPNAHVVLPHLASWRWLGSNVWYPHVHRCQQCAPGDWASAFAQIEPAL